MALFRSLSAADVSDILSAFGLPPAVAFAPIAAGTINTNVRIDTAAGRLDNQRVRLPVTVKLWL